MKKRPWPVVLLALFQFLSPIASILISSYALKISPLDYIATFSSWKAIDLIELFGLLPLTGVAIYLYKPWSYAAFLGAIAWISARNFMEWQNYPQIVSFSIFAGVTASYLGLVTYFLLPQVRAGFLNKQLRWWESKPRYQTSIPTQVQCGEKKSQEAKILNLSEGGAFAQIPLSCKNDDLITLCFQILDQNAEITAKVVFKSHAVKNGYGLEFIHTKESKTAIIKITRGLKHLAHENRPDTMSLWEDLTQWASELFTTGKGWLPEVPAQYLNAKKSKGKGKLATTPIALLTSNSDKNHSGESSDQNSDSKAA